MAQSFQCLAVGFSSGHDLLVHEFEPHIGLCAGSWEPGARFGFCVSLSLSAPPPPMRLRSLAFSLFSLSKINKC